MCSDERAEVKLEPGDFEILPEVVQTSDRKMNIKRRKIEGGEVVKLRTTRWRPVIFIK